MTFEQQYGRKRGPTPFWYICKSTLLTVMDEFVNRELSQAGDDWVWECSWLNPVIQQLAHCFSAARAIMAAGSVCVRASVEM